MLDTLANLAEILAGLAIIVSVIRFWPTLNEMRSRRPVWKPRQAADFEPFVAGLNKNKAFQCPRLVTVHDVRDAALAALHLAYAGGELRICSEIRDGERRGFLRFYLFGRRITVCDFEPYLVAPLIASFRLLSETDEDASRIEFTLNGQAYRGFKWEASGVDGEYLCIQLQDIKVNLAFTLESLLLPDRVLSALTASLDQSKGLVVFSGPPGSGKTVVAAAGVRRLADKNVDIAAPEEWANVPNISLLPQDKLVSPEARRLFNVLILPISEETSPFVFSYLDQAGLVLSCPDGEDAASVVISLDQLDHTRLWSGESSRLILNMRMIPTLCTHCRQAHVPSEAEWELVTNILNLNGTGIEDFTASLGLTGELQFFRAVGCDQCVKGYASRTLIIEALTLVPEMKDVILRNPRSVRQEIRAIAISNGMRTLSYHWLEWAALGAADFSQTGMVMPYGEV